MTKENQGIFVSDLSIIPKQLLSLEQKFLYVISCICYLASVIYAPVLNCNKYCHVLTVARFITIRVQRESDKAIFGFHELGISP